MSFSTLLGLQSAVLQWLGQPDDPLVMPHVPDMVRLFEAEAQRRLRTKWREVTTILAIQASDVDNDVPYRVRENSDEAITEDDGDRVIEDQSLHRGANFGVTLQLPLDLHTLRTARLLGNPTVNLQYLPPEQLTYAWGAYYTIEGHTLRLAPPAGEGAEVEIVYQTGILPLGPTVLTNWLLQYHPDAYLFGTLAECEAFVANDERAPAWLARRDATFASILEEDRHTRTPGGKLQMRPDVVFPLGYSTGPR